MQVLARKAYPYILTPPATQKTNRRQPRAAAARGSSRTFHSPGSLHGFLHIQAGIPVPGHPRVPRGIRKGFCLHARVPARS